MTVVELLEEVPALGNAREAGKTLAVLSLGSNLGDRRAHLTQGVRLLSQHLTVEAVSRVVESEAWGPVPQDAFLNVAVRVRTDMDAFELLATAQRVEALAGRTRSKRFGPRTLDVDLVFFGELTLNTTKLTLPHPRWRTRPFVTALLPDVVGEMRDPRSGSRLIDDLARDSWPPGIREVMPLDPNLGEETRIAKRSEHPASIVEPDTRESDR